MRRVRLDLIFPVSLRGVKTRTALLIDIVNEEFCLYCTPGCIQVLGLGLECWIQTRRAHFLTRSLFTIGGRVSEDRDIVLQPVKRCKDSFKVFPNDNIPKLVSPLAEWGMSHLRDYYCRQGTRS